MATFTPQDVITEVRRAIQDTRVQYRYDNTHMLGVVNQSLRRIALLRPDLFAYITTMSLVSGYIQTAPADSIRIIEVLSANEVNRETLDLALSTWTAGATGTIQDWMRHPRNPNQFFVYPPSANAQSITIEYARSPTNYALTDTILQIADAYFPCVVDCAVWLLESVDNEAVSNGRAKMFQDSFMQMLGLTIQSKRVTDNDAGGIPPEELA